MQSTLLAAHAMAGRERNRFMKLTWSHRLSVVVLLMVAICSLSACSNLRQILVVDYSGKPVADSLVYWRELNVQILRNDRTGVAVTDTNGTCSFSAIGNVEVEVYSNSGVSEGRFTSGEKELTLTVSETNSRALGLGFVRRSYFSEQRRRARE